MKTWQCLDLSVSVCLNLFLPVIAVRLCMWSVDGLLKLLHVVLHASVRLHLTVVCLPAPSSVCVCVFLLQPRHEYFNVPVYWLAACWAPPPARLQAPPLPPAPSNHRAASWTLFHLQTVQLCMCVFNCAVLNQCYSCILLRRLCRVAWGNLTLLVDGSVLRFEDTLTDISNSLNTSFKL